MSLVVSGAMLSGGVLVHLSSYTPTITHGATYPFPSGSDVSHLTPSKGIQYGVAMCLVRCVLDWKMPNRAKLEVPASPKLSQQLGSYFYSTKSRMVAIPWWEPSSRWPLVELRATTCLCYM